MQLLVSHQHAIQVILLILVFEEIIMANVLGLALALPFFVLCVGKAEVNAIE